MIESGGIIMHKTNILLQASLLLFIACKDQPELKYQKPNIIYILADDLGYGELGCYGQDKIETPNIDALAENGMLFTQHYTGSPVCAPARCVLLTGQHSGHAQIRGNDEWAERGDVWNYETMNKDPRLEGQRPVKAGTQTLGTLLQKAGYKTGIVGKWGLGGPLTEGIPNEQGFDFFFGYNCQRQAHTYFPVHLWKNREKVHLNNEVIPPHSKLPQDADPYHIDSYNNFRLSEYAPDLMQKELIQFIRENKDQPFFMYYATPIPHVPLQAPDQWVDFYLKKFGDEKPYLGNNGYFPHRYPHAAYAAMISYFDEQVGEIVKILKELGLYDNTIIMFSSDNGPSFNGGTDSPWFNSAGPFKSEQGWGKANLTEGGIRVPMIVQWPGKIKPGKQSHLLSAHYDVLPTICEIVGIAPEGKYDGLSFLPELKGLGNQPKHDFLYWEFPASGGQQAVRTGQWKGIRKNIFNDDLHIQLFNLEEDVQEQNDVSADHPDVIKIIENLFLKEHTTSENERFRFKQLGE
jgi:arylsulfatase A-like enzyme